MRISIPAAELAGTSHGGMCRVARHGARRSGRGAGSRPIGAGFVLYPINKNMLDVATAYDPFRSIVTAYLIIRLAVVGLAPGLPERVAAGLPRST